MTTSTGHGLLLLFCAVIHTYIPLKNLCKVTHRVSVGFLEQNESGGSCEYGYFIVIKDIIGLPFSCVQIGILFDIISRQNAHLSEFLDVVVIHLMLFYACIISALLSVLITIDVNISEFSWSCCPQWNWTFSSCSLVYGWCDCSKQYEGVI